MKVVRAVNTLQPLGQDRAVAAIREFLRVGSDWHDPGVEGTFLVLRVLFDVPEDPGYLPSMRVGAPSIKPPEDRTRLPRFPIALVDGLPILVNSGYSLAGRAESPLMHLNRFLDAGLTMRKTLLVPTADPLLVVDRLEAKIPEVFARENSKLRDFVQAQILNALETVYRYPGRSPSRPMLYLDKEEQTDVIAAVKALDIVWNRHRNAYSFKDGKWLPPIKARLFEREIWRPESLPGVTVTVIAERQNPSEVEIIVRESALNPRQRTAWGELRMIELKDSEFALPSFAKVGGFVGSGSYSRSSSRGIQLDEGDGMQFELVVDGKIEKSPIFKP